MSHEQDKNEIMLPGQEEGYYVAYSQPVNEAYNTPRQQSDGYEQGRRKRKRRAARVIALLLVIGLFGVGTYFFTSRYNVRFIGEDGGMILAITPRGAKQSQNVSGDAVGVMPVVMSGDSGQVQKPVFERELSPLSFREIYKQCAPGIVQVHTNQSSGTGMIISADGYILTARHVVENARSVTVKFHDGAQCEAQVFARDTKYDVALLKAECTALPTVTFGDSESLEVGEEVAVIGNSLGQGLTLTNGIISALDRRVSYEGEDFSFIQTNAAVNEGCSGGALINAYGQVVGMIDLKMASSTIEGVGYALSGSTLSSVLEELYSRESGGEAAYFGLSLVELTPSARYFYRMPEGLLVEGVDADTDTYAQGVRKGDMLIAINGISVSTGADFDAVKAICSAGDTVMLSIYRSGWYYDVPVILGSAG